MCFSQRFHPLFLIALACGKTLPAQVQPLAIPLPSSSSIEIDLVFPQNATYAPSPSFPVLFAIQNLAATPRSTPLLLNWTLTRPGDPLPILEASNPLTPIDGLSKDKTIWLAPRTPLLSTAAAAGTYHLSWSVSFTDCAASGEESTIENELVFTIHPAGQNPDPSSAQVCTAQIATLEITVADEARPDDDGETCGVVVRAAPGLANPCGASVREGGEGGVVAPESSETTSEGEPAVPSRGWTERVGGWGDLRKRENGDGYGDGEGDRPYGGGCTGCDGDEFSAVGGCHPLCRVYRVYN